MAGAVRILSDEEKALIDKMKAYIDKPDRPHRGGLVNMGFVFKDGLTKMSDNTACHAGLSYPNIDRKNQKVAFIFSKDMSSSYNKHHPVSEENKNNFLKWLTTNSPYRSAFAKKGGKAVNDFGYVVVDPNGIPANLMSGALIAHRMLWEYNGSIITIWAELVKCGVDPAIAFYHAHQVNTQDHTYISRIDWNLAGHNCLSGRVFTKETVLNFKNGVHKNPLKEWQDPSNAWRYSPVTGLWNGDKGKDSFLSNKLPKIYELAKRKVKIDKKINPFPKPGENVDLRDKVLITDFCPLWAQLLNEEYKDA